jgi:uncharacterized phage protein (TIGR01671 family)
MREIKFRAWDKVLKVMASVNVLEWQKFTDHQDILYVRGEIRLDWKNCDREYQTDSETIKKIELMQFTGLKDKNGKEIYESDILCVVEDVCVEEIGGYARYEPEGKFIKVEIPKIYFLCEEFEQEDMEVIGNIYENPELLKP